MRKAAVVGAGKIGSTIASLLAGSGDYEVLVIDQSAKALAEIDSRAKTTAMAIDDPVKLAKALAGCFAVVNAAPYHLTTVVAQAAKAAGAHYLDLTEDVAASRVVRDLAKNSKTAFIPQCGLAPGFITIAACDLALHFEELHDVRLRFGALPRYPSYALNYNLTWSTDGAIIEYCEPCEAIVNVKLRETPPLEEREEFALDGVTYEAFNTSGGLGTLCETLSGRVESLDYKSVRYPGHRNLMQFLLEDLRLSSDRDTLKTILRRSVPATAQDVVLVFITVSGMRDGQLVQEVFTRKIFAKTVCGVPMSAIQITTAGAMCAVLDLFREKKLPQRGFVRQEQVSLRDFLGNRIGQLYEGQTLDSLQTLATV